jgi:Holliday junction resolvase-like predicted endonuclease
MFAELSSFASPKRSKRSPLLADFLRFNCKQSKTYDLGSAGEKLAVAMFQDAGYQAKRLGYAGGSDLRVTDKHGENFYVEVKTATRSECRKSWQFCLNKAERTSISHSAYILLILIAEKTHFTYLIPSEFLGSTKQFTISSHPEKYRGKVAPFRVRSSLSFQAACNVMELSRLQ